MSGFRPWRAVLAGILLASSASAAALTPQEVALPPEQEARYRVLIHELRCLVCQNQTIADSNAELASDLRKQVHDRIAAGETDAQIREYVTARYGDFVLYKPQMSAKTVMLWFGPFLILAGALIYALRLLRARPAPGPPARSDAAAVRKLLEEERS